MPLIDFKELPDVPRGEALEMLTRGIGQRLGLALSWTGRGADRGRDLLFSEIQEGPLSARPIKWLVSCKHFANSDRSVSEADVGSILDKVNQHGVDGFLLVTTTTASTGLKELLDSLDHRNGGPIQTAVWDSHELAGYLIREEFSDLFRQYFPESFKSMRSTSEPAMVLETLGQLVPAAAFARAKEVLAPYINRLERLSGISIWPYDSGVASEVDKVVQCLVVKEDLETAARLINDGVLEFDAFFALVQRLVDTDPNTAQRMLHHLVTMEGDETIAFNAFELTKEYFEFSNLQQELDMAIHLDGLSLEITYSAEVAVFVEQELTSNASGYAMWEPLDCLSSHTLIEEVYINTMSLNPNKQIGTIDFVGTMTVTVLLSYDVAGDSSDVGVSFPGEFNGYFDADGMHIEDASVDTGHYYN